MATLDDKNTVRCECGSQAFETRHEEHESFELLPIRQEDGTVVHKTVCVTDVTMHLYCKQCGEEIVERPEPLFVTERPLPALPQKKIEKSE